MAVLRPMILVAAACMVVAGAPQTQEEQPIRMPRMPEWRLLEKVEPGYPSIAVQRRIQGVVRFTAIVGTDGRVERLRLISGHPLLAQAAREAAKRWANRPLEIGGKPVRAITRIDVHFRLDRFGKPVRGAGVAGRAVAVTD